MKISEDCEQGLAEFYEACLITGEKDCQKFFGGGYKIFTSHVIF